MKRFLYILLMLLCLVGCTNEVEVEPLYSCYSTRKDLAAAQVFGLQLNDSVKVDAVILVADDSVAWQGLKEEFDVRTSQGITSWMGDIEHPRQRVKRNVRPAWRVMAVHEDRTIAFYRIDTEVQREALMDYQFDKIIRN